MGIKDEANNLDSALKRGTNSARQLSFQIAQGGNNLASATHNAAQLADVLGQVAKLPAGMAGAIGLAVEAIGAVIGGVKQWRDTQGEIANKVREITAATEALNADARNSPRLATEIRITEEKNKQVAAIVTQQKTLGQTVLGIFGVANDFGRVIAALEVKRTAALQAFDAEVARTFSRMKADIQNETEANAPWLAFLDPTDREVGLLNLEKLRAQRRIREEGRDQGLSATQINELVELTEKQFTSAMETAVNTRIKSVGDSIGRTFVDSISDGIIAGLRSGSTEIGFRALLGGMLAGLGRVMVDFGTQSLLAANLMTTISEALRSFAPAGAIGPSLTLIALGSALQAIGGGIASGGRGGGGGGGGGFGGSSSGATIIDRGLINPANASSPNITPNPVLLQNILWVAMDDPRLQRDLLATIDRARARRGDR